MLRQMLMKHWSSRTRLAGAALSPSRQPGVVSLPTPRISTPGRSRVCAARLRRSIPHSFRTRLNMSWTALSTSDVPSTEPPAQSTARARSSRRCGSVASRAHLVTATSFSFHTRTSRVRAGRRTSLGAGGDARRAAASHDPLWPQSSGVAARAGEGLSLLSARCFGARERTVHAGRAATSLTLYGIRRPGRSR